MKSFHPLALAALLAAILGARSLPAASPNPAVAPPKAPPPSNFLERIVRAVIDQKEAEAVPARDPTVASPELQMVLGTGGATTTELPTIELKGRMVTATNSTGALLAIDKRLFQVQQGSRIPLQVVGAKFATLLIEVREITPQSVRLDVGPPQAAGRRAVPGRELILY
jgi:hypothetical protein